MSELFRDSYDTNGALEHIISEDKPSDQNHSFWVDGIVGKSDQLPLRVAIVHNNNPEVLKNHPHVVLIDVEKLEAVNARMIRFLDNMRPDRICLLEDNPGFNYGLIASNLRGLLIPFFETTSREEAARFILFGETPEA